MYTSIKENRDSLSISAERTIITHLNLSQKQPSKKTPKKPTKQYGFSNQEPDVEQTQKC